MSSVTIKEAIQGVQSLYSKGVQSKDTRLTDRHIYSTLLTARAVIIRQQINSNQRVSQDVYQTLPCVELIEAPVHECPCVPSNGCIILRSKFKIPTAIQSLDTTLIQSATTLDGGIIIDPVTFESVRKQASNKYTSQKPKRYIRNRYIYITVLKKLRAISMTVLLDDPIEGYLFPSVCGDNGCACSDITDFDFHVNRSMLDGIYKLANSSLIGIFGTVQEDNDANAQDDTELKGNMIHQEPSQP